MFTMIPALSDTISDIDPVPAWEARTLKAPKGVSTALLTSPVNSVLTLVNVLAVPGEHII